MKFLKYILSSVLLLALLSASAKSADYTVTIPDANFKAFLLANYNTGTDHEIQASEVATVANLDVSGLGISNLTGIEAFVNLGSLDCHSNNLTTIDLSSNLILGGLNCSSNALTSLDISNNPYMSELVCSNNSITAINLTGTTGFEVFDCSFNHVTSLDFSQCPDLYYVAANNNNLVSLIFALNTSLAVLDCSYNQLTSLNLSGCALLYSLICSSNRLTYLDITQSTILYDLLANDNRLPSIDLSKNVQLNNVWLDVNQLSSIDVSKNILLDNLLVQGNQLTALDVSANTLLTSLGCNNNVLTCLNLKGISLLTYLDVHDNTNLPYVIVDDIAAAAAKPLFHKDLTQQYTTDITKCNIVSDVCTNCPKITCGSCISPFKPMPNKDYLVSVWVREETVSGAFVENYNNAGVQLDFLVSDGNGGSTTGSSTVPLKVITGTPFIEGWQKIEQKFTTPATVDGIKISLLSSASSDVYYDDLRILPMSGSIKSYVYDPLTMRLMSELDENNYATYYEYDQSGALVRVKKETERGVMTIQESVNNTYKR